MDSDKPLVGIVMGSDSDWPLVKKACETLREAVDTAYRAAGLISFDGMFYRKDIAHRAFNH